MSVPAAARGHGGLAADGGADVAWWQPSPAAAASAAGPALDAPADAQESAVPFRGVLVFTFILLIGPQVLLPALAAFRIALVAAATTGLTLLLDRVRRGQPLTIRCRHFLLALGLLVWSVVTVPMSLWPGGSVNVLVDIYLKSLVVFWLLANVLSTTTRVRRLAWTLAILSTPIAFTGVRNFATGGYVKGTLAQRIVGYEAPLTGNPNDLALMLNLLIPIIVALLLTHVGWWARLFLLFALCLNVGAIIVTFSRAGFITLAATSLACAWKLRRRPERRWVVLVAALALCALPLLPSGYVDRVATTIKTEADRTGSAQARWGDALTAVYYAVGHPLVGAGIGQDTLALNRERGALWTAVHNVYLQHAVELGVPGLVLFIMLLAACLGSARRVERLAAAHPGARDLEALAAGIHVSLIAFAVGAFFHPVAYHFYFYYFAGIAVALEAIARSSGLVPERSGV